MKRKLFYIVLFASLVASAGIINRIPRNIVSSALASAQSYLLLHLDNNITDSATGGNAPHTITNNNVTFTNSAGQYKFGYAAVFNGSNAILTSPNSADWDIMADKDTDFTIDCWFKAANAEDVTMYLVNQWDDDEERWQLTRTSTEIFQFRSATNGVEGITLSSSAHANTDWHHIAVIRKGSSNIIGLYIDGTQEAYDTMTDAEEVTLTSILTIGKWGGAAGYYLNGNLDELRISATNHFNANPNTTTDDTITDPTSAYE